MNFFYKADAIIGASIGAAILVPTAVIGARNLQSSSKINNNQKTNAERQEIENLNRKCEEDERRRDFITKELERLKKELERSEKGLKRVELEKENFERENFEREKLEREAELRREAETRNIKENIERLRREQEAMLRRDIEEIQEYARETGDYFVPTLEERKAWNLEKNKKIKIPKGS